jgi:K+-transporting ATPase ATPase C chain
MWKLFRTALLLVAVFTVIVGLAYPGVMTVLAGFIFPYQAQGSLIERQGKVVGSELIGQRFTQDGYFHGRPSAAGKDGYNALSSGGTNSGPTSKAMVEAAGKTVAALRAEREALKGEHSAPVPVDLVTASGSGLDPDITPAAALFQAPRVAKARQIPEQQVRDLIAKLTQGRSLGLFGEPRVNVLDLNLALDAAPTK